MPLHEITPEQFPAVDELFRKQRDHHLFCAGILAGNIPGRVLVDDPARPRTGLVLKGSSWCYLGGDPENGAFIEALSAALAARQYVGENAWGLLCFVPSDGWRPVLQTLVKERPAIPSERRLYLAVDAPVGAPDDPMDFTLYPIDDALPATVDGSLPGDVRNVLDLRKNGKKPDQAALGFAAVRDSRCAAWSMVDCIVGKRGEIGLYTEPEFRRLGLGMAVSRATLRFGLTHGLGEIHWDVIAHNMASIRMAEKHGLRLARSYEQHLLVFGEMGYVANVAYHHLDNERFEDVLKTCRHLVCIDGGAKHAHYLAGAALAGLGKTEAALSRLHEAVDRGWDDLSTLESSPHLRELLAGPEWKDLAARLVDRPSGLT